MTRTGSRRGGSSLLVSCIVAIAVAVLIIGLASYVGHSIDAEQADQSESLRIQQRDADAVAGPPPPMTP